MPPKAANGRPIRRTAKRSAMHGRPFRRRCRRLRAPLPPQAADGRPTRRPHHDRTPHVAAGRWGGPIRCPAFGGTIRWAPIGDAVRPQGAPTRVLRVRSRQKSPVPKSGSKRRFPRGFERRSGCGSARTDRTTHRRRDRRPKARYVTAAARHGTGGGVRCPPSGGSPKTTAARWCDESAVVAGSTGHPLHGLEGGLANACVGVRPHPYRSLETPPHAGGLAQGHWGRPCRPKGGGGSPMEPPWVRGGSRRRKTRPEHPRILLRLGGDDARRWMDSGTPARPRRRTGSCRRRGGRSR